MSQNIVDAGSSKKVAINNVDVGDGYHLHLTVASRDPADLALHVTIDF